MLSVSGSTFQPGLSLPLACRNEGQGLCNWLLLNSLAVVFMSGPGVLCSRFSLPRHLSKVSHQTLLEADRGGFASLECQRLAPQVYAFTSFFEK